MSDETKHVTPDAPRDLKPFVRELAVDRSWSTPKEVAVPAANTPDAPNTGEPKDFDFSGAAEALGLPSDSGELERLLTVIEANRGEVTRLYDSITPDFVPPDSDFEKYLEPIRASRKSVLDLFERLRAEQFVELTDPKTGNKLPAPAKVVVEALSREILALQQSALTRDEVAGILDFHDTGNDFNPNYQSAIKKLRSLSSLRSSSLGEQK